MTRTADERPLERGTWGRADGEGAPSADSEEGVSYRR
jgi:hypothetical protein